jgi:hypothetical protein
MAQSASREVVLEKARIGALRRRGMVVGVVSHVDVLRSLRDGLVTVGEDHH